MTSHLLLPLGAKPVNVSASTVCIFSGSSRLFFLVMKLDMLHKWRIWKYLLSFLVCTQAYNSASFLLSGKPVIVDIFVWYVHSFFGVCIVWGRHRLNNWWNTKWSGLRWNLWIEKRILLNYIWKITKGINGQLRIDYFHLKQLPATIPFLLFFILHIQLLHY